ncbi:Protein NRT1/ PTR FAMILY 1.2 [Linum perenne]
MAYKTVKGWKTLPFIIGNDLFEKVATVGLLPVCIDYLTNEYCLHIEAVSTFILVFGAARNFTPIFGAVASNFYGRFRVIVVGSGITLMGMTILWATSIFPELRPRTVCSNMMNHCTQGEKAWRLILLFSSFAIMAIGGGGIRPCSPTLGADQINDPDNPDNRRTIEGYYSGYYALVGVSVVVSVLVMSEMHEYVGWRTLFAIPPALMLLSVTSFLMRSSRYVKISTSSSGSRNNIGTVIVATWRRRWLPVPQSDDYHASWSHSKESTFVRPTDRLSFLNRACLLTNTEETTSPTTFSSTIHEVEKFKALLSVIPIWSTGIISTVATTPGALPNYQAQVMDCHIGRINLTPASYIVFNVGTMTLWMILYSLLRLTSTRLRNGIPPRIRMATSLVVSCLANVVAGLVEHRRRVVPLGTMSGNWLIPQLSMMGLAEGMYMIGQLDFFNSQLPEEMKSVGNALVSSGQCFGMLTAAMVMGQVRRHTGWVKDDLNCGRIDYYYWLVAGLSFCNFCYFLVCSWVYGNDRRMTWDDRVEEEARTNKKAVRGGTEEEDQLRQCLLG